MGGYTFLEIGGVTKNGGDELRMGGMKVVAHYETVILSSRKWVKVDLC